MHDHCWRAAFQVLVSVRAPRAACLPWHDIFGPVSVICLFPGTTKQDVLGLFLFTAMLCWWKIYTPTHSQGRSGSWGGSPSFSFLKKIYFILFIYLWLCWVFVSVRGLSLVAASGGHSSSRCAGLSLSRPLWLRSTGSRCAGSVVVAHGPSCSTACGIFPDQGLNPCPLHWQADSQPLRHQGSPSILF